MKHVTITFDFEGGLGMPFEAPYDLAHTTTRLLKVLRANRAKAVFFVSAKLIEDYPEIIRAIHAGGHEIGFHGYAHEHMHALSPLELAKLAKNLARAGDLLKDITGYTPKGFRAPYLMAPKFHDPAVYRTLAALGFTWISNCEIRLPEELFRPDRSKVGRILLRNRLTRNLLLVSLNVRLVLTQRPGGGPGIISALRWLLGPQDPYLQPEGLLEYPLTSPLDCDLVGFPKPQEPSGANFVEYAAGVITSSTCQEIPSRSTATTGLWVPQTVPRFSMTR